MTPFLTIPYPIYVGRDLLDHVGELVRARGRVFVITSEALRDRFGERVALSFPQATILEMDEGEANKTLETASKIVTLLLECGAKRDSMAVVVGGGMVGDTAGFAASIFLRGIDLVHVPTTLLAQVDSSIGGKLAVNHPKGKNLIGSFFPPHAVIADTAALDSLPPRERLSGLYEALKGGVIGDESLFAMFEEGAETAPGQPPGRRRSEAAGTPASSPADRAASRRLDLLDLDELVRKAIRVKATIVSADEKEADLRRLLNYGHTIAHGIEAALHYQGITHGEAVAWGMIGANAIAVKRGLLPREEASRIERVIRAYDPAPLPALDRAEVLAATEHDKKNTGDSRVMVFPKRVGECVVVSDVTAEEVAYGIDSVLDE
ncbi:MAG TPA: 3-dehydroquinate synthase [Thermoanaerobaculia bacterium]|nr:3-dehydroquinate synthase [Thermoanaerobaculia bacterium]